jgi:hypothetical protein
MLSPVKAIAAGALVFALGGAFLIAQPFGQPSSLPSATSDGGLVEPVAFTGTWSWSSNIVPEETVTNEGVSVTLSGGAWNHVASGITDPRFDGDVTVFASSTDHYGVSSADLASSAVAIWSSAWRVENEDGAWQSEPAYSLDFHDTSGAPYTAVFRGEGAYEGLTAVVELELDGSRWDLRGLIFDGGLPPDPEPRPLE